MVRIALTNIKKWRSEPTVWLVFVVLLLYVVYFFGPVYLFAGEHDETVSAWIVSGFFTHGMMAIIYVALIGLMFCNAPYYDSSSQFYVIRVGRVRWIMGQILYVCIASFIMVLFIWLTSWLMLLPRISFSNDWGRVIRSAVMNGTLSPEHSLRVFFVSNIEAYEPIRTSILSFVMAWSVTFFGGMLFMMLNAVAGKVLSFTVFGVLWFLCMLPDFTMLFQWGKIVFYVDFFRYVSVFSAREYCGLDYWPPLWWCLGIVLIGIIIFSVVTVIVFCRRDLDAGREE
ncbi:MAG: hypothetical protein E7460_06375 [Ruminococcaceae bacterium]|nr:hypothetical protein [Oscillospiraceae bacterium]